MEIGELYAVFDSYSPYEVAVLTLTSPREVDLKTNRDATTVLTGKDAYIWAGAVAHVLIQNPELNSERVRELFRSAVMEMPPAVKQMLSGTRLRRSAFSDSGLPLVQSFLKKSGVSDELDIVFKKTEDAVRSLEWRGHIVDPFNKKIGAMILTVTLVVPVGFTSKGENDIDIRALTWEYVKQGEGNQTKREFRVKVRECTQVILEEIVPSIVNALEHLSNAHESDKMEPREVQSKLRKLGYYKGQLDGNVGPQTINGLRQFQQEYSLDVTGHLDQNTVRRLKSV